MIKYNRGLLPGNCRNTGSSHNSFEEEPKNAGGISIQIRKITRYYVK
jgi:hypothetical protein